MKNYKEYGKSYTGMSDGARLRVVWGANHEWLEFGEDGTYYAYIVDEDCEVPEHYHLVMTCNGTTDIYGDDLSGVHISADKIEIYRAGERGCLIKVYGEQSVESLQTPEDEEWNGYRVVWGRKFYTPYNDYEATGRLWFAVTENEDDNDLGTGSFSLLEAVQMLGAQDDETAEVCVCDDENGNVYFDIKKSDLDGVYIGRYN